MFGDSQGFHGSVASNVPGWDGYSQGRNISMALHGMAMFSYMKGQKSLHSWGNVSISATIPIPKEHLFFFWNLVIRTPLITNLANHPNLHGFFPSKLHTQGNIARVPQGCIATGTVLGPERCSKIGALIIAKMVGKPLGWGPLNNQPHKNTLYSVYLLGISLFKGLLGRLNS